MFHRTLRFDLVVWISDMDASNCTLKRVESFAELRFRYDERRPGLGDEFIADVFFRF